MMLRTHIRGAAVGLLTALWIATPAWGAPTLITYCGQSFEGRGILVTNLDCTGFVGHGINVKRGRLDLRGFTVRGAGYYGVNCEGTCRIFGPGTVTESGLDGIHARQWAIVRDVVVSDSGLSGIAARGFDGGAVVSVKRVIVTDNGLHGIEADNLAFVRLSRVLDNGESGIHVGVTGCDSNGRMLVYRSIVIDNGTACPEAMTCADLTSCSKKSVRPRVKRSSCRTSHVQGSGFPGSDWDVCSLD